MPAPRASRHAEPSTDWQESIAPDEYTRFAGYAHQLAEVQQRRSATQGPGRALHRKQLLAARAELEVLADLPTFARQGLFAQPSRYPVQVRLSNGGMDKAPDRQPDIRGFAFAVLGLADLGGDSALGEGQAVRQCFALINHSEFAFARSAEFVDFVLAASAGTGSLVKHLLRRHGWLALPGRLAALAKTVGKPFGSFATETFHSAAPLACGPYAVRVRLVPSAANAATGAPPARHVDWGADMAARLARGPLVYDLELQPFVDEAITPIEDASVAWPTPYTSVARLTLPLQDLGSPEALALAQEVEAGVFDPWAALAAHRPLGDVMRARKVVYFASQQGRGAA